jgi:hypothetical protein
MFTIALIIFLAFLALALFAFPWRLARIAASNSRRVDGSISRKRAGIELKQGSSFMADVLLVPVLATSLFMAAFFVVDRYVIPLPLLRDVLSLFDAQFAVWDENMESGQFGDVGVTYGEWARSRGYSENTGYSIRKFLKNNWLALVVVSVVAGAFFYWFTTRYYLSALKAYNKKLMRRRENYRYVDVRRSIEINVL